MLSCSETALLHILNDLLTMTDGGNNALLVLLDLSAAFDTIDHVAPPEASLGNLLG